MDNITKQIWLGSAHDARDTDYLVKCGITAILNVSFDVVGREINPKDIRYVKIALSDDFYNKSYMKHEAVDMLKTMINNYEVVLVHCSAGISRSAYVVARAIAELEDRDVRDVLEDIKKKRPIVQYGPLFKN